MPDCIIRHLRLFCLHSFNSAVQPVERFLVKTLSAIRGFYYTHCSAVVPEVQQIGGGLLKSGPAEHTDITLKASLEHATRHRYSEDHLQAPKQCYHHDGGQQCSQKPVHRVFEPAQQVAKHVEEVHLTVVSWSKELNRGLQRESRWKRIVQLACNCANMQAGWSECRYISGANTDAKLCMRQASTRHSPLYQTLLTVNVSRTKVSTRSAICSAAPAVCSFLSSATGQSREPRELRLSARHIRLSLVVWFSMASLEARILHKEYSRIWLGKKQVS